MILCLYKENENENEKEKKMNGAVVRKADDNVELVEIKGPAFLPSKTRAEIAKADPIAYILDDLKAITKKLHTGSLVTEDDRLSDLLTIESAAEEYLSLQRLQDYINVRTAAIKQSFFETLNERDISLSEDDPKWYEKAPAKQLPGEIEAKSAGIKFQRGGGSFKQDIVNQKQLQKDRPRLYKNYVKTKVIPAVEEQTVQFFDEEAFIARADKDKDVRKYIISKYNTPRFTVYNLYDEEA